MDAVVVVGSGASGVHFALSLLERGRRVQMLDVGHPRPEPVLPTKSFNELKTDLDDPVRYFLGGRFESVSLPGGKVEFYKFPPSKDYVFVGSDALGFRAEGFAPLSSFAAGGLAEAWTGGCYPFTDTELADFPFGYSDIEPYYERVAGRIGISGADDDMSRFFPLHSGILDPLDLDVHSRQLFERYDKHKRRLNQKQRCYMGRSRIATLSSDLHGRKACSYLGRCLWGCPTNSLYTPAVTLKECLSHEKFSYIDNVRVDHFRFNSTGRINKIIARADDTGAPREFDVGTLVLAAGTLCSSRIFLESIYRDSGELARLGGLMDNRQVLMPYINLRMVGHSFEPNSYQYHQIALGLESDEPRDYVHGLITTLKTALVHPVIPKIPTSLGMALALFRNCHAALGLANVNFTDWRRDQNGLCLEADGSGDGTRLVIEYHPHAGEARKIEQATKTFRKILRTLGCIAPASMVHVRPMGASVHYAGTIPMTPDGGPLTTDETCRSNDFENLYFVDGTTFPSLPAKNLTFTLMANATRVAEIAF